jgi:hypothetical protein
MLVLLETSLRPDYCLRTAIILLIMDKSWTERTTDRQSRGDRKTKLSRSKVDQ